MVTTKPQAGGGLLEENKKKNKKKNLAVFLSPFLYLFVISWAGESYGGPHSTYGGQMTISGHLFSPAVMWVPVFKPGLNSSCQARQQMS